jgi:hypothetical protein
MNTRLRKKHDKWKKELHNWQISGSRISVYCRTNNIPIWKFYYWKKKFSETGQGEFIKLSLSERTDTSSTGLWIELSSGIRLVIESGFNSKELSRVLAVAGGNQC